MPRRDQADRWDVGKVGSAPRGIIGHANAVQFDLLPGKGPGGGKRGNLTKFKPFESMKTIEVYEPENLERWSMPSNYGGEVWPEYFVFLGQNRDSDALTRANFDSAVEALKAIPEPEGWGEDQNPWEIVREGHWAVGWVEWITIHQDATQHLEAANEMAGALSDYPVLCDERFSEYEETEAQEVWERCYSPQERIKYIRQHRSQFEFRSFSDLLGSVRGQYFGGYASDLIH